MKKYIIISLLLTSLTVFSQDLKSTQYGLITVKKGRDTQIGFVTVYNDIMWIKFDYELAEEFKIKFTEKTPASKIYYIDNEKAHGGIIIDQDKVSFDLFIKSTKQHKSLNYKIWH